MRIIFTRCFEKDYKNLPSYIQNKLDKQLGYLLENIRHPSLFVKKIKGTQEIWEGRIDKSYRFTFQIIIDAYVLRRTGTYKILQTP